MPTVTIHPTGEVIYLDLRRPSSRACTRRNTRTRSGADAGGCAICKVDCRTGEFTYNRPVADSVISDEERTDGTCLSCRAVPQSDVVIEFARRKRAHGQPVPQADQRESPAAGARNGRHQLATVDLLQWEKSVKKYLC